MYKDEKVEMEVQYNCLLQKYEKLKEDYQTVLTQVLKFREEQIDKVNKMNELETEYNIQFFHALFSKPISI
jgi:hypothetical protein